MTDDKMNEPLGVIERGKDGKLAIYSTKFNIRFATFSPGAHVGIKIGDLVYIGDNRVSSGRSAKEIVTVKPLEWHGDFGKSPASNDLCYRVLFNANGSAWGFSERGEGYYVERAVGFGRLVSGPHPTRNEAKAAAQGDYEQRVLSCLSNQQGTEADDNSPPICNTVSAAEDAASVSRIQELEKALREIVAWAEQTNPAGYSGLPNKLYDQAVVALNTGTKP